MRHPAYLPSLLERAKGGSKAAVMGIGHIAGPAATEALLALLEHATPAIIVAAAGQIMRRLPARGDAAMNTLTFSGSSPYQIDPLLPVTLRVCALEAIPQPLTDEFVPPLLKALDAPDWRVIRVACGVAWSVVRWGQSQITDNGISLSWSWPGAQGIREGMIRRPE